LSNRTATLGLKKPSFGINVLDGNGAEALNMDIIDAEIAALKNGRGGGGGSDAYFAYAQNVASSEWTVRHDLGKYPSVSIVDSSGHEVFGDVSHIDANQLTVIFSAPFAGYAYLS
jgi:hypothetical protein